MAVLRETFRATQLERSPLPMTATVERLVRHAGGDWTFYLRLEGAAALPDGRAVFINRQVAAKATQQVGRKPRCDAK